MTNREVFTQALNCFADPQKRRDYFDLYAEDICIHGYQGVKPGLESVKQFYYAFWNTFPDAKVTAQDLISEGETLTARYTITGTLHEPFLGVAATGQRIELPGISILHFRNGQCYERWTCSDSLILMHQIGALMAGASR